MGLTSTWPRNVTPRSGVSLEALEAQDASLHRAQLAYLGLAVFTAILFGRPGDVFWSLQPIPMAQITAIAAIAAYSMAFLMGRAPLVITTEIKLVAGMTICFALSIPFAFWRGQAFDTFVQEWLKTLVIFYLLTQTVFTLDRFKKLLWVIIFCMFFVSVFSLTSARAATLSEDERFGGVGRGFFSGNYLGLAVGVTLPYIAALLVRSKSFFKSLFLVSSFAVVMLMVVKTASRGSMLCVIISLALVWALVLRKSRKAHMIGVVFVVALVVAILIAPEIFWDRLSSLWDPESYATSSAAQSADQSRFQREGLLRRSILYTLQNPVLGVGLGNFPTVSGTMTRNSQEWKGTHNTYTQISSEAGIPALLLFIALMFLSLRKMYRIYQDCGGRAELAELALLARATQASIMAFMYACFFAHLGYDYYFYYLVGFGVSLQAVHARLKQRLNEMAPAAVQSGGGNGRSSNGKNGGSRDGIGSRGRAW